MRFIGLLLAVAIIATSCSSSKKSSTNRNVAASSASSATNSSANDGSGFEKAIVIDKKNESEGIAAEYKWLREHYPGYKTIRQSLNHKGNKSYDILSIETKDGEKKDIYFDITNFFGKF